MCQTGNLYDWPDDEDQSWQDVNDIICDMPQPMMSNRGHLTFPENLIKKAEEKSMEQEFVTCVHLYVLFVVYGSIMFKIVLRGPFCSIYYIKLKGFLLSVTF